MGPVVLFYHFFQNPQQHIPMTGSFFYMEELGQYLYDLGIDTKRYIPDGDELRLDTRYTFRIPSITKTEFEAGTTLLVSGASFPLLVRSYKEWLNKAQNILIFNTAFTHVALREAQVDLTTMQKIRHKCYLLYEPGFETTAMKSCWFEDQRLLPIKRGFYFKHYVLKENTSTIWYLYQNNYAGVFATEDKKQETLQLLHENKIDVAVDVYDSLNPANKYAGLVYIRKTDFMPRLPFEFWHYEKPVRCFALSDGLIKRVPNIQADGNPVVLDKTYIPQWDLSHVSFLN